MSFIRALNLLFSLPFHCIADQRLRICKSVSEYFLLWGIRWWERGAKCTEVHRAWRRCQLGEWGTCSYYHTHVHVHIHVCVHVIPLLISLMRCCTHCPCSRHMWSSFLSKPPPTNPSHCSMRYTTPCLYAVLLRWVHLHGRPTATALLTSPFLKCNMHAALLFLWWRREARRLWCVLQYRVWAP
jgi:hypothetical protein